MIPRARTSKTTSRARGGSLSSLRARLGRRSRAGMTLIEIMIVVAIMGMLASGVLFGQGALPRARLRTSCMRLAAAYRFAYVHALTSGKTTRVSFPVGGARISVEESDDAMQLDPRDPLRAGGAEAIEAAAVQQADAIQNLRPRAPRAQFTAISGARFRPRDLDEGITVARLYSQHDEEARTEGPGHVYFFAGGQAERAVVHLRNSRGEVFSIVLDPMTGRAEVFDRAVEPPAPEEREETETDSRERVFREVSQ
jgi:prepilin-type N-terminal cleavage/methylation domain-containing protein